MLLLSCAVGVVLLVAAPLVGAPLVAASVAALVYTDRKLGAIGALLFGIAYTAFASPGNVLFVAVSVFALYLAVLALRSRSTLGVSTVLAGVFALAAVANDSIGAMLGGTTVKALLTQLSSEFSDAVVAAYGPSASTAAIKTIEAAASSVVDVWPSLYFAQGVLLAGLSIGAVAWLVKRIGADVEVAPIALLDLSPHALWPMIVGLLALALSSFAVPGRETISLVASNLLVCARVIFLVQAVGVAGHFADKRRFGLFSRVAGFLLVLWLESAFWIASVVGLADFWANFRRLPRGTDITGPARQESGR